MSNIALTPAVTPGDRLGMMLFLGVLLHGLIILGVSFDVAKPKKPPALPTLDIILVPNQSVTPPKKADYLAQANQQGGGTVEEKIKPSQPVSGPVPQPNHQLTRHQDLRSPANKTPTQASDKIITSKKGQDIVLAKPKAKTQPQLTKDEVRKLVRHSLEIASLTAQVSQKIENYASRPRKKHINANVREYAPAAYMAAWTRKVQRLGNLNYPEEARRKKLSGRLQLTVGINKDGSIREVIVQRRSGHPILDQAAVRVVKLGAPYARIPDSITENGQPVDILYITRTWEFTSANVWYGHDS